MQLYPESVAISEGVSKMAGLDKSWGTGGDIFVEFEDVQAPPDMHTPLLPPLGAAQHHARVMDINSTRATIQYTITMLFLDLSTLLRRTSLLNMILCSLSYTSFVLITLNVSKEKMWVGTGMSRIVGLFGNSGKLRHGSTARCLNGGCY